MRQIRSRSRKPAAFACGPKSPNAPFTPTPAQGRWLGAGLAGLTALACGLSGCDKPHAETADQPQRPDVALTVSVVAARQGPVSRTVVATGTVMPWQELTIEGQTSALGVLDVRVRENDVVRAGDVLVRFDDRILKAQLAQQRAAVAEAQANLDSARQEAARGDTLMAQKAMSVEAVETRRTTIRTDQAKLDQAQAALDQLAAQLDQTVVRAPMAGIVSTDPVKLGTVTPAGTELLRLIRDGRLEVQAKVPERDLAQLRPGQAAVVKGPDGVRYDGKVRDVAAKVDPVTRLGTAYVALPPNGPLKAGMFADVAVTVGTAPALTIPEQALAWPDGRPSAFVIDGDGKATLVRLSTGSRQGGFVAVTDGLKEGDRVAVAGMGFLHDGDRVRVAPDTRSDESEVSLR